MVGCKGGNSASEHSLSVLSQKKRGRTPLRHNFEYYIRTSGVGKKSRKHFRRLGTNTVQHIKKMHRGVFLGNFPLIILCIDIFSGKVSPKRDICKKLFIAAIFSRWRPNPGR